MVLIELAMFILVYMFLIEVTKTLLNNTNKNRSFRKSEKNYTLYYSLSK